MNPSVRNVLSPSKPVNDSVKLTSNFTIQTTEYINPVSLNALITNRDNPTRGKQCREVKTTAEIMKIETINNKWQPERERDGPPTQQ